MGCGDSDDGEGPASAREGVKARGNPLRGGGPELGDGDVGIRVVLGNVAAGHTGRGQLEDGSHGDTFAKSRKSFQLARCPKTPILETFL